MAYEMTIGQLMVEIEHIKQKIEKNNKTIAELSKHLGVANNCYASVSGNLQIFVNNNSLYDKYAGTNKTNYQDNMSSVLIPEYQTYSQDVLQVSHDIQKEIQRLEKENKELMQRIRDIQRMIAEYAARQKDPGYTSVAPILFYN